MESTSSRLNAIKRSTPIAGFTPIKRWPTDDNFQFSFAHYSSSSDELVGIRRQIPLYELTHI